MTFINLIKTQLNKIKSFLKADRGRFKDSELIDVPSVINKISEELDTIRNEVIPTINQARISSLDPKQSLKIQEEVRLLSTRHLTVNYEILKDLLFRKELLNTNKVLQQKSIFKIKTLEANILHEVKKTLLHFENASNKLIDLENNRLLQLNDRQSEIEILKGQKRDLLQFSLIEIQKIRDEEIKENERIEKERILENKYVTHLENAKLLLERLDFDLAIEELDTAFKFKPERFSEIETLRENIFSKKTQYNCLKSEFDTLIKKADNESKKQDFDTAIQIFENAKRLNFDDSFCDRKISALKNKILQIKKLESERKRLEQKEREAKTKYKDDASAIIDFFKVNKILAFYHYTDSRNLNSIIQNNGLYSLNELIKRRIEFIRGSETGEKPDYVRLSYTRSHPLMFVSREKDRILSPKVLEIDLTVASYRETLFSNVNAARTASLPTVKFGNDLSFLRNNVKFDIIKQEYFHIPLEERPYYQAEVLVKGHLPLEHITNLTKQ